MNIYLVSSSPQRKNILQGLEVSFKVLKPQYNEKYIMKLPFLSPEYKIMYIAKKKLYSLRRVYRFPFVAISSDTALIVGRMVIGKPVGYDEAFRYMRLLSDKMHTVISAICVWVYDELGFREYLGIEKSEVVLKNLLLEDIYRYLDSLEWRGRAGGYAIQNKGKELVLAIRGSITNVVGLPLSLLFRLLPYEVWKKII
jgi:septum formation protein